MSQPFDPFAGHELELTAPTTAPQQEIWLAIQFGGPEASLAYNESVSLDLAGPVDAGVLKKAWEAVASRHEALRTTFTPDGLTLCVEKEPRVPWTDLDWSGLDPLVQKEKRAALLEQEVTTPFDLVETPGFRVHRLSLGPDRNEFVLTGHHLVCDGYSTGVLLTELCQTYTSLAAGKPADLPPAPRFSDYSLSQKEALNGKEAAEAEHFWLKALGTNPEALDLPTDYPRPAQRTYQARREDILVPTELLEDLRAVAAKAGLSLSAMFLTAFEVFLFRLTGQPEFAVGMPAAGQTLPGFGGLVGHCVNTLPMPVRLNPEAPFLDAAKAVRSSILDGLENQVLSFGNLLQKLQVPRDPSRIPLVPVLFNLDPPMKLPPVGSAKAKLVSHPRKYEAFEIFINGTETDGTLVLETTYNTSLFDRVTIVRWIEDFQALLQGVVTDIRTAVQDLPVLSPASRTLLLDTWNTTTRPLPPQATAVALVEAQAAKTPGALAVRDAHGSLTYKELDERANFLARRLLDLGTQAEDLVGVCLGRSADMVAVLLGIWKAGAAYVPLDPDFPGSRLAYIVEDSKIQVLVTETALEDVFADQQLKRLWLDREPGRAPSPPPREDRPDRLAYVLHTSGSTGKPKGVQIEQGNLVNFLSSMAADTSIGPGDVLVAVTTLSFDIAGLELFLPTTTGAQTVVASREDAVDGQRLAKLLTASSATFLQATPATWQLLTDTDWKGVPGFKALCGGEALPRDLGRKILERCTTLWNVYGPTETTIWSTMDDIRTTEGAVSIGRPIGNTTLYIVDPRLNPVPAGAPGELLIGGSGVSRGYLNRPDLTAEKFLPDPFSRVSGARMYRTGDICRYGSDGRVYFQRRNDSQVKVRGFRIELGEIETALAAFTGVQQAVASVREFGPGDARLVGYLVVRSGDSVNLQDLKEALSRNLPHYMVPQHLVPLSDLPLTPNGKVDRKALPLPSEEGTNSRTVVEPTTPVQVKIAAIWSELLRIHKISIKDSFFDLGGHSMLAARMLARVKEGLGVEIPMRVIFQAQSIESLALRVEASLIAAPKTTGITGPVEELDF